MEPKMGMKKRFNGRVYYLVAVTRTKKELQTFADNQHKVGGRVRITRDDWGGGFEYTAWHGGYRK